MLSKAEILYLQGQKQVSQSCERKLKCLIRKKIEISRKELPFSSKLLKNGIGSMFDNSTTTTEQAAPIVKISTKQTQTFCNMLLCYDMSAGRSKFKYSGC